MSKKLIKYLQTLKQIIINLYFHTLKVDRHLTLMSKYVLSRNRCTQKYAKLIAVALIRGLKKQKCLVAK